MGYSLIADNISLSARKQADSIARAVRRQLEYDVFQQVQPLLALLARGNLVRADALEQRLDLLPVLQAVLRGAPIISGLCVGYESGDFFLLHPLITERDKQFFSAPANSALVVRHTDGGFSPSRFEHLFFDEGLHLLLRRMEKQHDGYDPRSRAWYQEAMQATGQVEIGPSLLGRQGVPGMIFAERSLLGKAVVGISIHLEQLSKVLQSELPTPGSHLALLEPGGTPITGERGANVEGERLFTLDDYPPIIRYGIQKYQNGARGDIVQANVDGRTWLMSLEEISSGDRVKNLVVVSIPWDELPLDAWHFLYYVLFGVAGVLLLSVPAIGLATQHLSRPLRALTERARHPLQEESRESVAEHSGVAEIVALAQSVRHMQSRLHQVLGIISAIGAERNFPRLLGRVLTETLPVAEADGGIVVLLDEKKNVLGNGYCYWTGHEIQPVPFPEEHEFIDPKKKSALSLAISQQQAVQESVVRTDPCATDIEVAPGFVDPDVIRIDAVCVPLVDRMKKTLGVLTLFKAAKTEAPSFQPRQVEFLRFLAAAAATALEVQHLIKEQHDLRDSFIHILAGAIDAKSPHTGGHCERVPIIFQKLLQAACDTREGPLADFTLDEDGWEEAKLAGWLHDCGKVTTPEYVMDKATKLETLYDRIHEIRTRFEVLKRDAEIVCLKSILDGADSETEQQRLAETLRELDDDFAFVASCNTGGEGMADSDLARLTRIGQRGWTRTLDKRLGISREELARMEQAGVLMAPARETLLMNNGEHIIPRGEKDVLHPDNPWGIKVSMPPFLYNRGELYNLSVLRGTLTEEERYKINDHVTQTIIMLSRMPLPRELQRMPEIAGAHHETMDGQGYPRCIQREEMSWSARMMTISDIFEALTASDRPYKTSKTVREALTIMDGFKERQQIDADLYELFLQAKIPQWYAAEFLKPEQNDVQSASGEVVAEHTECESILAFLNPQQNKVQLAL